MFPVSDELFRQNTGIEPSWDLEASLEQVEVWQLEKRSQEHGERAREAKNMTCWAIFVDGLRLAVFSW